MDKHEFKTWLEKAVNDSFMDLFYYDRKECETMPLELLKEMETKGILNKELMLEVFNEKILNEFKDDE